MASDPHSSPPPPLDVDPFTTTADTSRTVDDVVIVESTAPVPSLPIAATNDDDCEPPPPQLPPPTAADVEDPAAVSARHRQQLIAALESLESYNPDFNLTPDVVEIMRLFFHDLEPADDGTIALASLFDEIERLDPKQELVPAAMRDRMWHDMVSTTSTTTSDRIDFHGFCHWVMHWKEISPNSIQHVYTSWAQQLAMVDFGLHEADGVFVVRADELPRSDVLKTELTKLLHARASRNSSTCNVALDLGHSPSASDTCSETLHAHSDPAATAEPAAATAAMTVSKSFVAGGAAGIVAKSILAPVDRVKMLFQVSATRQFSVRNAVTLAQEIYALDGFKALFRGNVLNLLRVVPYAGVQHSSFDYIRRQLHARNFAHASDDAAASGDATKRHDAPLSNLQLVTAGSLAGGLSLIVAYPLDIVRARYMVQHFGSSATAKTTHQYTTIAQAVTAMYAADGVRSFYRGLVPSLLGTLPYTGIGFALNEKFKTWMLELKVARLDSAAAANDKNANDSHRHHSHSPSTAASAARLHPFSKFVCSYFAACIAQTTTYPMDTIRRRIQTDGFVPGAHAAPQYTSVITTARLIYQHESWRGFFKGVSVNWLRSPLATGISLTTYDVLKDVMGVEKVV